VLRLACQEQLLPGATLEAKWDFAVTCGYDGIELRGQGAFALRERRPELRRALHNGVVMPTVCVEMTHFIGAFDDELRHDAVEQLRSQLSVIAELGGKGAMTPASWGMFSRRLPPFEPPRTVQDDRKVLLEALHTLGEHAAREGVRLYLEPLNRYEDHMVNRLEQAVDLVVAADAAGGLGVVADTFHMNIEEDDPAAAVRAAAAYLGHVQVSDSNREQPGAGHLDWPAVLGALDSVGYDGYLAVECRLRGDPATAVRSIPAYLRRLG
jgi:sugar phosphate isomerase/epimerase